MGDAQPTEDHGFAVLEVKYSTKPEPIWLRVPLGIDLADGEKFGMQQLMAALNEMMEEGVESFIQLTNIHPETNLPLTMFLTRKNIDFIAISHEPLGAPDAG